MAYLTMKNLLEAGVHFGHQTRRWNPKMKPYIFGARNGIYIIDLQKTVKFFKTAYDFVQDTASQGGTILFVGTKKQAQNSIKEEAERCDMPYVSQRWLGGMLTNLATIQKSINRLKKLDSMFEDGTIEKFPKKERLQMSRLRDKLEASLGGIKNMEGLPSAVYIVDPNNEHITVQEANKLGIPIISIVDTNCDPDGIDYIIPGNDDAIRAIKLITSRMADAVLEGKEKLAEAQQAETDKEIPVEGMEVETSEVIAEVPISETLSETSSEETIQ